MNRKPIKYKRSFCAFLDVLGFEALVNSSSPQAKEMLEKYYWLVNYHSGYLQGIFEKKDIKILTVSDSIILSYELSDSTEQNIEKLQHFLIALALIQHGLASQNLWLRGGVSVGEVCFDPNESFVVGKGYVQAFKLEAVAKYPRIILDVSLVKELGFNTPQDFIEEINKTSKGGLKFLNWNTDILFDWDAQIQMNVQLTQDVPLFIDYLSKMLRFDHQENADIILNHIQNNLLGNISHYEKYKWVAQYIFLKTDTLRQVNQGDKEIYYESLFNRLRKL